MVLLHIISLVFSSNMNIFKTNIPHVDAYLITILMPLLIFGYETNELNYIFRFKDTRSLQFSTHKYINIHLILA